MRRGFGFGRLAALGGHHGARYLDEDERDPSGSLEALLSRPKPAPLIWPELERAPAQDLRVFHPLGTERPRRTEGDRPVTVVASPKKAHQLKFVSQHKTFGDPLVCVRRTIRREVIMAKYGGGSSRRRKRRTWTSEIGC